MRFVLADASADSVMWTPGSYTLFKLERDEFMSLVRQAEEWFALDVRVSHPTVARHIEQHSGVPVNLSEAKVRFKSGDWLLVCKIAYHPDAEFSYYLVHYMAFAERDLAAILEQRASLQSLQEEWREPIWEAEP